VLASIAEIDALVGRAFGALDAGSRERRQVFLLEQWEKTGETIIFVTHDLEEAVFIDTRMVVLSQHYTDDRAPTPSGAARASSAISPSAKGRRHLEAGKLDPCFAQTVEHMRDMVSSGTICTACASSISPARIASKRHHRQ
jgi:energy-coupling factor transporter ATP-binding protein EcfA2